MYADVKELRPGAARKVQTRLRKAAAAVMRPQSGNSYPSVPPRVHLSPTFSSRPHRTGPQAPNDQHRGPGAGSSPTISGLGTTTIAGAAMSPQFVLLCVNTKRSRTLEHVNVAALTNDEFLFDAIREGYYLARHPHEWKLSFSPGFVPLLKWLSRYVGDMSIFTPKSADYVRVGLLQTRSAHQLDLLMLTLSVSSDSSQNGDLSLPP
jgi:hypothetical protein